MKRSHTLLLTGLVVSVVWAACDLYTHAPELLGTSRPEDSLFGLDRVSSGPYRSVIWETQLSDAPRTPLPSPPADTPRFHFAEVARDAPEKNRQAVFISDDGQIAGRLYNVKRDDGGRSREIVDGRGYVESAQSSLRPMPKG